MADTWYFAYGSNLSIDRKQDRTGLIRRSHRARLANHRLAFNKASRAGGVYANIVPQDGAEVWGVVYLCNASAMAELDLREGVMGGHYKRVQVTVELDDGEQCVADTYVAGRDFLVAEGAPTEEYLSYILTGATAHELPNEYIQSIRRIALQIEDDR